VSGALLSILPVSKPTHAILYHVPYPYDDTDRICDLLQFTNLLCYYVYTCEQDPQLELAYLTDFLEVRKNPCNLLIRGAALQLYLRGKRVHFKVDTSFIDEVNKMVDELGTRVGFRSFTEGNRLPNNLKLFPKEYYDEALLRDSDMKEMKGFEDRIAQIREWDEHGT
jgi:hypothetical protein